MQSSSRTARLPKVKIVLRLAALVLALVGINQVVEALNTCACEPDCWCKRPVLRHFRWIVPFWHHLPLAEVERRGAS